MKRIVQIAFYCCLTICAVLITSCDHRHPGLSVLESQQVDSLIESKTMPTFTDAGKYSTYVSESFTQSLVPIIYESSGEAFNMCVEICIKKYGKVNNKLFAYEWNKNYRNFYKFFDPKYKYRNKELTDTIKSKPDTIGSLTLTK